MEVKLVQPVEGKNDNPEMQQSLLPIFLQAENVKECKMQLKLHLTQKQKANSAVS